VLWTWSYPTITKSQRIVVIRKCNLKLEHNSHIFVCARYGHDWFYIHCSEVFDSDKLPKVSINEIIFFSFFKNKYFIMFYYYLTVFQLL
jgi:hypothetical protein